MVVNSFIENTLDLQKESGLYRETKEYSGTGGIFFKNGKRILNFSSNDYLNLSNNQLIKESAIKAIETWGTGSTASRLMCGTTDLHIQLEEKLADLMGTESALVFGSGFLTNLGLLSAVAGNGDSIIADKYNHASLIDGMRLSNASWKRYKHKDTGHLEKVLESDTESGNKFIVTDSIFSMDGDIAPLKEIIKLGEKYGAGVIVDEAHALGIFASNGAGIIASENLQKPFAISGTLSKSFGGYGGFIAGSSKLKDFLVNKSRSFIYSTALPPSCLGSALGVISFLKGNKNYGQKLLEKVSNFHSFLKTNGLPVNSAETHILTIKIGDNEKAVQLSEKLRVHGILATAIRPPTVPEGTARLRLSVTMAHTIEDLKYCADMIKKEAGFLYE